MLKTVPIVLILALLGGAALAASDRIEEAILDTRADIAAATEELNKLRSDTAREKEPLAVQIETIGDEVARMRKELDDARQVRRMRSERFAQLEAEVEQRDSELDFIGVALREYRRALESYAGAAEAQKLLGELEAIDDSLKAEDSPARLLAGAADLLELSQRWTESGLRVRVIEGECLDSQGVQRSGRYAVAGPLEYFAGEAAAGIAVVRAGSSLPSIFDNLESEQISAIAALIESGEAVVPVDVSGGNALKARKARKSIAEHIKAGGFTMYPLLAIGALSLLIALWKFIELSSLSTSDPRRVEAVIAALKTGDTKAAEAAAARIGRPLRTVILEGVKHHGAPCEQVEEMMHERVLTILPALRRYLGALAVFGAVAPLLGLLGTVTGMIHTFQLVTIFGTGDAKMLSGGISEALVTTETGLAIAIPVLLVHAYLSRRAANMADRLEHEVVAFNAECRSESREGADGDA